MRIVRIVHLTYEMLLHLPVCLCSLCSGTALYVRVLYRTVQRVYENFVGTAHLLHEVLLHIPVCLCSLCSGTELCFSVLYRTVQQVYENSV